MGLYFLLRNLILEETLYLDIRYFIIRLILFPDNILK